MTLDYIAQHSGDLFDRRAYSSHRFLPSTLRMDRRKSWLAATGCVAANAFPRYLLVLPIPLVLEPNCEGGFCHAHKKDQRRQISQMRGSPAVPFLWT